MIGIVIGEPPGKSYADASITRRESTTVKVLATSNEADPSGPNVKDKVEVSS
jgi:hypothetical protein